SSFFSSRRRHTSWPRDWSSDVCSSDLSFVGITPQGWMRRWDGEGRVGLLPGGERDASFAVPAAHPALRRDADEGMREQVANARRVFLRDRAEMHDGGIAPVLRHVDVVDLFGLRAQILNAAQVGVNVFEGGRLRRSPVVNGDVRQGLLDGVEVGRFGGGDNGRA